MPTPKQLKNRKKVIKALRSGEYKQGFGWFYEPKTDCYCAVGVTQEVTKMFSVSSVFILGLSRNISLVRWNDIERLTFPQIADRLEALVD